MRINIIGLGYIGLPTALSLATEANEIIGTDKNPELIKTLQNGNVTFKENGLSDLFEKAKKQKIVFQTEPAAAEVYIIAVPTPYDERSKKIDAKYVATAVREAISVAPRGAVIAVESTISPGTMEKVVRPIVKENGYVCGKDIYIAHVPERIIPGNMVYELQHNNRTIGVEDNIAGRILSEVYSTFCKGKIVTTSIKVAEMTKVVENTSRDIQIAFANELARICHREEIDVNEVIRVANMHPRVNILSPGPGVGGHCISVDPWFLVGDYPDLVDIISSARRVNDGQPRYILAQIQEILKRENIKRLDEVGFYGLTYKENVDDVRESPTIQMIKIMEQSLAFGAKVYDPMVNKDIMENQYHDFNTFLKGLKLLVVMVGHNHIKEAFAKGKLDNLLIYDTRNCLHGANIIPL